MATKTTNYNLTKPAYDESADIEIINANMDIIDAKMKEIEEAGGGGGKPVDAYTKQESDELLSNKVDKVNGKGLSTNDYTDEEKNKLNEVGEQVSELKGDLDIQNEITKSKYKRIKGYSINSDGTIYAQNKDLICYEVVPGKTIEILTTQDSDSIVLYGFFTNEPFEDSVTYNNSRVVLNGTKTTADILVPDECNWIAIRCNKNENAYITPKSMLVGNVENAIDEMYSLSEYGNFFDYNNRIIGYAMNSGTGIISYNGRDEFISKPIFMDFSKTITISNGSHLNAYCYRKDGTYLGRVYCGEGKIISNTYPDTDYILIWGVASDTNLTVSYGTDKSFKYYNPIDGNIEKSSYLNKVLKPLKIRVATYNMGDFSGENMETGSAEVANAMIKAMSEINADIYGLQYDVQYFGESGDIYNSILRFKKYYSDIFTAKYNGKGFLTNIKVDNVSKIDYTDIPILSHKWFLVGDIDFGIVKVKLITLHVDWRDKNVRKTQLQQVKAYADQFEYCIILGDFNPDDYIDEVKQSENLTTQEDLLIFTSDGKYVNANAGFFGSFNTFPWNKEENIWDGDNILVTSNITINYVNRLKADYMNDHAILYADIIIY